MDHDGLKSLKTPTAATRSTDDRRHKPPAGRSEPVDVTRVDEGEHGFILALMESLLVVTGPPGAGKSTVAEVLALALSPSVLVEGDAFFRFLRNGAIDPWLSEADDQNTTVTRVAGAAAGRFSHGGFHTIYDGVIGPWFLDEFLAATGLAALDYVVLLPPVDRCVERVRTRHHHGFTDEAATRHMHDQFTRQPPAPRHLIARTDRSPSALAVDILDARHSRTLRYPR